VKDDQVVQYFNYQNPVDLQEVVSDNGYSPSEAKFIVEDWEGFHVLLVAE
jgi:hypothetical protein